MKHRTTAVIERATSTPDNETPKGRAEAVAQITAMRMRDGRSRAAVLREAFDKRKATEGKRSLITFFDLPEPALDSLAEDQDGKLWAYRAGDDGEQFTEETIFFRMSQKDAREWFSRCNAEESGYVSEPDFFDVLFS